MTIKITENSIEIGKFKLKEVSGGISFDGTAKFLNNISQVKNGYTSGTFVIQRFPFANESNISTVITGSFTQNRRDVSGQSSSVSGYVSGGNAQTPNPSIRNTIDKFPFATNADLQDVGDLTAEASATAGQQSLSSGYASGVGNSINKFPFATDTNANSIGVLTIARGATAGQSSDVSGYTSGGPGDGNVIDKFSFATDGNATDVGDLTTLRYFVSGQSSSVSGYTSGGYFVPAPNRSQNVIDKFPFATDSNATDVGDLAVTVHEASGQSSTTSGYVSSGQRFANPPTARLTFLIQKFPFATDSNAVSIGTIRSANFGANCGHQG